MQATVTYLFDPGGVYVLLAGRMLNATTLRRHPRRRRGHWLCLALNDAAKACEIGTYVDLGVPVLEDVLSDGYGLPRVVARVLSRAAATSAKLLLPTVAFVPANFPVIMRGLIALVCPNLAQCPTQADVTTTLLAPYVGQTLRHAVIDRRIC